MQLVSFRPDRLLFLEARELKDKLTCLAWWGWPALTACLSLEREIRSTVWPQNSGKSHLAVVPLKTEQHLWVSLQYRCHGLGKQSDWWPVLAVMPCRHSGQSDLSEGDFSHPGWTVIILFSYLRCLSPSSFCPCAELAPESPYFSCTEAHRTGCSSPHVVSLGISREEG